MKLCPYCKKHKFFIEIGENIVVFTCARCHREVDKSMLLEAKE